MPGPTTIPAGDPKAVKRWSGSLFIETSAKSYWDRKFVGEGDNKVIQRLTDLESDAGDTITFDLSVLLRGKPTAGDNRLEGKEEALRFYSDQIMIDQLRKGVTAGGKMTRKRTLHNLRMVARDRLSDYWAKYVDELYFIYLSGARGMNEDFIEDTAYIGHAGNALNAPDATHIVYGGTATSKATLAAGDKMTRALIERVTTKARMLRAVDPSVASMLPVTINGEPHFALCMSGFQEFDLRTSDTGGWLEMQKAAASAEGRNNPIFKGGLGLINNTVLHSHESAIRFNDYGAGGNVKASRALFMGRQAGVVAYGTAGGLRFFWNEEQKDHKNELAVAAGFIGAVKKTRFNGMDFGSLAVDTAFADPNA